LRGRRNLIEFRRIKAISFQLVFNIANKSFGAVSYIAA
jgi:hypothetical protein